MLPICLHQIKTNSKEGLTMEDVEAAVKREGIQCRLNMRKESLGNGYKSKY